MARRWSLSNVAVIRTACRRSDNRIALRQSSWCRLTGSSSSSIAISRAERYEAVHDFGGFPRALYEITYAPPGLPGLAQRIAGQLQQAGWPAELVDNPGIDHGVWIPLQLMYPAADIPIVQLSVPLEFTPQQLFDVGKILKPMRSENILILGSGGIVHNLRLFRGGETNPPVEPWAQEFDDWFGVQA